MPNPLVVNASPVIYLSRAGFLDLLHPAGDPILLPQAVLREINRRGRNDPAVQTVAQTSWLAVVDPGPVHPSIQQFRLGDGEAEVLTHALAHPGTMAVLDDLTARRCAIALSIPLLGTLAIVLDAKLAGMIPLARPVMEALRHAGMYLSDHVLNRALAKVGE